MKDYKLTEKEIDGKLHYFSTFKKEEGIEATVEVSSDVYNAIDDSMKSIRAEARKERRHSVCSFDESIGESEIIDDQDDTKRLLKKVMKHMKELTDVQQRRLRLYFFENKTFKEIAKIEGISYPTARESVTAAIEILKSKKYF